MIHTDKSVGIKLEHVSKKYCRHLGASMRYGVQDIGRNLLGMGTKSDKLRKDEFWAVNDVSFEVGQGETLGIVGVNGSGKSTILKMLNGIFMPDKGKITVNGKVGALIEIGAGFHPMLTGRENIFINGAILGMSQKEIKKRFDEIVDFAEIGDFLDSPVKNYSSGMYVRLGFAIAAHCTPDILLVDEVLAVGDLGFIAKCSRKIAEFIENGGTLILVSHSMQTIRNNVKKAVFLHNGILQEDGDVNPVCDHYESFVLNQTKDKYIGQRILNDDAAIITGVDFIPENGQIEVGADLTIKIHYKCKRKIDKPVFTVSIRNLERVTVASSYSYLDGFNPESIEGEGFVTVKMASVNLVPGEYLVSAQLSQRGIANILDWHWEMYRFKVIGGFHCYGLVDFSAKWHKGEAD